MSCSRIRLLISRNLKTNLFDPKHIPAQHTESDIDHKFLGLSKKQSESDSPEIKVQFL